jgi:hypothetical protein
MFRGINALFGATDTVIAGTVIRAALDAAELYTDVAVRVTGKSLSGAAGGAVYVTGTPLVLAAGKIVPQGVGEHDKDHVTPWFCGSFTRFAVNCAVAPAITVAEPGSTLTSTPGMVIEEETTTCVLATAVAVTVTGVSNAGIPVGAV